MIIKQQKTYFNVQNQQNLINSLNKESKNFDTILITFKVKNISSINKSLNLQKSVLFHVNLALKKNELKETLSSSKIKLVPEIGLEPIRAFSARGILSPLCLPFHHFGFGGTTQIRTGDEGFADLCLTTWLWCHTKIFF